MKIAGREIGFKRTVLTYCKLTEMAPERNLAKLFGAAGIASPDYVVAQTTAAKFIAAMNEGYENAKRLEDPAYEPNPISAELLLSLDVDTFNALYQEAMQVYRDDGVTTVEVAPPKGKKTAKRGASN